jgi:PAS domain S-box-containing protein
MSGQSDRAGARDPSKGRAKIPPGAYAAHLLEALPTAVVLIARNGRIVLVNRETERLFGHARGSLVGSDLEVLLPERLRNGHSDLQQQFLARLVTRSDDAGLEMFGRRADGIEVPVEVKLAPLELGGESMLLAEISDITVRRDTERRHEQQQHQDDAGRELRERDLQRSNLDLEEFAYVASHDLKAPLRAIAHLAEWIGTEIRATATPEAMDYLDLLEGRVRRLQMLLDGLLAYSRVGRSTTRVEAIDLNDLVHEMRAELDPAPGFAIRCRAEMPTIRTHRTPLRAVLQNLILNGLKHHDRAQGVIEVAMRRLDELVEFRVTDDGPGIEPRFHDRIFGMFQTLASRDQVESSGIGLTIVKKHVLGNGGTIRIESEPPTRGTTVVFTWKEAVS